MEVLAGDLEGVSNETWNCNIRPRAAWFATAPESDALRTAVRSLQGVFRGRPRGLPGLRMHREGCHWQTCRESCCGVKRFISQRGIRQVQPEQNGCMAVLLGLAGLALASKKEQCFYSARVSGGKGQTDSANSFSRSAPFSIAIQGKSQSSRATLRYRA